MGNKNTQPIVERKFYQPTASSNDNDNNNQNNYIPNQSNHSSNQSNQYNSQIPYPVPILNNRGLHELQQRNIPINPYINPYSNTYQNNTIEDSLIINIKPLFISFDIETLVDCKITLHFNCNINDTNWESAYNLKTYFFKNGRFRFETDEDFESLNHLSITPKKDCAIILIEAETILPDKVSSYVISLDEKLHPYKYIVKVNEKSYLLSSIFGYFSPDLCVICLSTISNITIFPCKHTVICNECMIGLRGGMCPVCRKDITKMIEIKNIQLEKK